MLTLKITRKILGGNLTKLDMKILINTKVKTFKNLVKLR